MSKFESGDKVVCINNEGVCYNILEIGKTYTINIVDGSYIRVEELEKEWPHHTTFASNFCSLDSRKLEEIEVAMHILERWGLCRSMQGNYQLEGLGGAYVSKGEILARIMVPEAVVKGLVELENKQKNIKQAIIDYKELHNVK